MHQSSLFQHAAYQQTYSPTPDTQSKRVELQANLLEASIRLASSRDAYHKLLASMMFTRSEFRDATSRYAAARVQYKKALDAYSASLP